MRHEVRKRPNGQNRGEQAMLKNKVIFAYDIPMKTDNNTNHPGLPVGGRPPKYPWRDLDIGQSFFVDAVRSVPQQAYLAGRRLGRTFITRREDNGFRVWRTE